MCYYIGIQDLVANALIELVDNDKEGKVSFKKLNEYGAKVLDVLNENGERAVLVLSRDDTNRFIHNCTNYFKIESQDNEEYVCLKEGVTTDELRDVFRLYTTYQVLQAFVDEKSLKALGITT